MGAGEQLAQLLGLDVDAAGDKASIGAERKLAGVRRTIDGSQRR